MNAAVIIARKRDGHELTDDEIAWFISGFTREEIPDYQMSALAMAIFFRGMSPREIAVLTREQLHSGVILSWPDDVPRRVDKHSTGGIGDKVSLILAPMLACCGLPVPMISGRGLGATGGTLDKLESISGWRANLSSEEVIEQTRRVGCVIASASDKLAPADRKIYALRDVTGTVPSIPLITASIMSKKLAAGLNSLVLDVKYGTGAFMKTRELAQELAKSMVSVGRAMGVQTVALLTDMNQPLGRLAGHANEVDESIATLRGEGPADLVEVTVDLGAELLLLEGKEATREAARKRLSRMLVRGEAYEKFREMIAAQGGDIDAPRPIAPRSEVVAARGGYIGRIETEQLGLAIVGLGGGRRTKEDRVDHSVGLEMHVRLGDAVQRGQRLVSVFAPAAKAESVRPMVAAAVEIQDAPPTPLPLVAERIA